MQIDNHKFAKLLACIHISPAKDKLLFIYLICDAFLLNEAYVADSKVEQQAFICVKGVVW